MKYPKLLVFLFLWICISELCHSQHEQFAGPFQIVMRQIGHCDEIGTGQFVISSTRISKASRTKYLYSTNMTTEVIIDDEMTVEADLAKFGNGGWRPHYMQLEFPQACTTFKQLIPAFYTELINALHADCPIPPGTYVINDLDVGVLKTSSSLPNLPYGKYRSDFSAWINGTLIGCTRYFADVVPERRARPQKKYRNTH